MGRPTAEEKFFENMANYEAHHHHEKGRLSSSN
jgi:hypothetical protein